MGDLGLQSHPKDSNRVCTESNSRETVGWVLSLACNTNSHSSAWWPHSILLNWAFKSDCSHSVPSFLLSVKITIYQWPTKRIRQHLLTSCLPGQLLTDIQCIMILCSYINYHDDDWYTCTSLLFLSSHPSHRWYSPILALLSIHCCCCLWHAFFFSSLLLSYWMAAWFWFVTFMLYACLVTISTVICLKTND